MLGSGSDTLDITELCSSCTLTFERPAVAGQNTFGVRGQRRRVKGLHDGNFGITFHHDYDAGGLTQFLWDWYEGEDVLYVAVRANDAAVGTDNPEWRFNVAVTEMPVIDGGPEDLAAATVSWPIDGVPAMATS